MARVTLVHHARYRFSWPWPHPVVYAEWICLFLRASRWDG
jgi:hypothetical protein